jgi:hypothetical protein
VREYGRIATAFWSDELIKPLPDEWKLFAAYLLTNAHSTMLGAYRLPNGYASDDLGEDKWTFDRVSEGFRVMDGMGFATRCVRTQFVIVHKYLKLNPVKGPKQREGLVKVVRSIPRGTSIGLHVFNAISTYVDGLEPERLLAIKTHLDPKSDTQTIPLALGTPALPIAGAVTGAVAGTGEKAGAGPSGSVPPPAGKEAPKTPAAIAFDAYATAFGKRYKTAPIQNAKVRALFKQLVERVGEAASHVAAFFVSMDRDVYVKAMHAVDLLVRDAEGVHAAWRAKSFPDLTLADWWTTTPGVKAKGKSLGVKGVDGDTWNMFVARVFLAAGDGPHLDKVDSGIRHWMEILGQEHAA